MGWGVGVGVQEFGRVGAYGLGRRGLDVGFGVSGAHLQSTQTLQAA